MKILIYGCYIHLLRSVGNRVENLPAVIIDSFLKYFFALQLYPVA